jgi:proteasome lid subunit RPN8/RPN11
MNKYIILFFAVCLWNIDAFPQGIKVHMSGNSKPTANFNDKKIELVIIPESLSEDKKIGLTMRVNNNDKNYKFYLFSDKIITNDINGKVDNIKLWDWVRKIITKIKSNAKVDMFNFNGQFVSYDRQLLKRRDWIENGYYGFSTESNVNFDTYTIISDNVNENSNLTITYTFLVVELSENNKVETLTGLTDQITYTIPSLTLGKLFKKSKIEPEKPTVESVVEKWNKEIDKLLLELSINNVTSYKQLSQNPDLKRLYDSGNYNQKIGDAIKQVNKDLADEKFNEDRQKLLDRLEGFLQTYEPESKPVLKEPITEVPLEKKQEVEPEKKEDKPSKKETVDPCIDLRKQFDKINTSVNSLKGGISYTGNVVKEGLIPLRSKLKKCKEIENVKECAIQVAKEFYDKQLIEQIAEYENTLNTLTLNFNSLIQKENFKDCSIQTITLEQQLADLKQKRQKIEHELIEFQKEIDSLITDEVAFNETVKKYSAEIDIISNRYRHFHELFLVYDNKLWDAGKLEKSEIKILKKAPITLDSINTAIDSIIINAKAYYSLKTGQENFPEATFKDKTKFIVSKNDCVNVKMQIEDLVDKAIKKDPRGPGQYILAGLVGLILFVSAYAYYMGVIRKKFYNKLKNNGLSKGKNSPVSQTKSNIENVIHEADGIEIIEDDDEKMKGIGLNTIRKLTGINYFEVDVQSFIRDTAVRRVFFKRDFIIKAYRYFEDSMLHIGNGSIDDLYEYGGFIIGNWDYSPYDKEQYELSLEYFIEPGDDAKFSKFNIDFGYTISFRMEEMLMDLASHGNEQVFVGWLHSHPGHNVFLSNYDIEVQERFRNQYHPNRHIALVLEPTTNKWDLGLFTFKQSGIMNNKDDIELLLSFHELYSWAIGENQLNPSEDHLKFNFSDSKSVSFDRSVLLQLKMFIERELSFQNSENVLFNLFGIKSSAARIGYNIHIASMEESKVKESAKLNHIGLFTVTTDKEELIEFINEKYLDIVHSNNLSLILVYLWDKDVFNLIPLKPDGQFDKKDTWIEFSKKDFLPFLSK